MQDKFWKNKSFEEMSLQEWESLCDRCGLCCLHKLKNEDDSKVYYSKVVCQYYDFKKQQCSDYQNRSEIVPTCVPLTPERTKEFTWLPSSCAYRIITEGKDLPPNHPLINSPLITKTVLDFYNEQELTRYNDTIKTEDYIDWDAPFV